MKKIFIAVITLLAACHNTAEKSTPTDSGTANNTVVAPPIQEQQPAAEPADSTTQLQAIKWDGLKEMTDETFKNQVLESSVVTLVDFNATWCGPCKQQKPILDKLVKEYKGKVNFASVDVDQCPETASNNQISSIPTLAFYQNAKQNHSVIGLTSYEELKAMIDKQLNEKGNN